MKTHKTPALLAAFALVGTLLLTACGGHYGRVVAASETSSAFESEIPGHSDLVSGEFDTGEPIEVISPPEAPLPPAVAEVVRLAQSGVSDEVLLAFIENASEAYDLTAEDILYLHDIGLSEEVITGMIQRGGELREDLLETVRGLEESAPRIAAPDEAQRLPAAPGQPPANDVESHYAIEPAPLPASAPQEVHVFYRELAPYGSWVHLPGHGWAWQPTVAVINVNWHPYHDRGRWFYSTHGWYWHSYYSWGWAPFHYGRWYAHPARGWVWFPDTTWGPAWVTWRVYDDHYYGWAPLPPAARYVVGHGFYYQESRVSVHFSFGLRARHFTFVPSRFFCDPHFHRHSVRGPRVQNVFVNSTVVNNVVVQNNTIINKGIDVARVERSTRVPRVDVRDWRASGRDTGSPGGLSRRGAETIAYRRDITDGSSTSSRFDRSQSGARGGSESRDEGWRGRSGAGERTTVDSASSQTPPAGSVRQERFSRTPSGERAARTFEGRRPSSGETGDAAEGSARTWTSRRGDEGETRASPQTIPSRDSETQRALRSAETRSEARPQTWGRPQRPATSAPATVTQAPSDVSRRGEQERRPATTVEPRLPVTAAPPAARRDPIIVRPNSQAPERREWTRPSAPAVQAPNPAPALSSPAPVTRPPAISASARPPVTRPAPAIQPAPVAPSAPVAQRAPVIQRPQPTVTTRRPETFRLPAQTQQPPSRTVAPAPVAPQRSFTPPPSSSAPRNLRLPGQPQTSRPPAVQRPAPSTPRPAISQPRPAPPAMTPAPARPRSVEPPSTSSSRGTIRLPSQSQRAPAAPPNRSEPRRP